MSKMLVPSKQNNRTNVKLRKCYRQRDNFHLMDHKSSDNFLFIVHFHGNDSLGVGMD